MVSCFVDFGSEVDVIVVVVVAALCFNAYKAGAEKPPVLARAYCFGYV